MIIISIKTKPTITKNAINCSLVSGVKSTKARLRYIKSYWIIYFIPVQCMKTIVKFGIKPFESSRSNIVSKLLLLFHYPKMNKLES